MNPISIHTSIKKRWAAPGGYREVLVVAFPLILSTGSWSVQHFFNRIFLTWYAPDAVAAAMPAGMVNYALLCLFLGTVGYVGIFAAQYFGAGQEGKVGRVMWQSLWMALAGGLLCLATAPCAEKFFAAVGHQPAVQRHETIFYVILCYGALPALVSAAFAGVLSGLGRTVPVMWVTFGAAALNVLLDWLLIFGRAGFPGMGIAGAGWANNIANLASAAAFAAVIFGPGLRRRFRMLDWRPERRLLSRLLAYGLPSGIQFFIDMAGFTVFILLVGRLGTTDLAASTIAFNINTLAFMPMIGIGITVSVLVGQFVGRGDPAGARLAVRSAFEMTFSYMALVAGLFFFAPGMFLAPFAAQSDPASFAAIAGIAAVLLRFVAVYTLFDGLNIVFSSAIKGAGDTRFVMAMIGAMSVGILIVPSYIAVMVLHVNIYACWGIATAYVIALGLAFWLRYKSGVWERMRVIEPVLSEGA
ncbi:MAG: MATE family efflux transporter [Candidatus Edwardsbacteria bacterium]|nr:MATE family efflux transporter [Candidatus Edwardsbacteria bacterium]